MAWHRVGNRTNALSAYQQGNRLFRASAPIMNWHDIVGFETLRREVEGLLSIETESKTDTETTTGLSPASSRVPNEDSHKPTLPAARK
jgi:hypothetical protein